MIRRAHTSEEFEELSMYFQAKEEEFRKKAEDETKSSIAVWLCRGRALNIRLLQTTLEDCSTITRGKADEFAQWAKTYQLRATNVVDSYPTTI